MKKVAMYSIDELFGKLDGGITKSGLTKTLFDYAPLDDYEKASDPTKKVIEPRLKEIEVELTKQYFIFTRNEIKWMFGDDKNK